MGYKLMANGDAVPNGIVNDVIAEAMVKSADGNDAFLIDGYPLDEAQANDFVSDIGPPTVVVCLEIPDEVAIGRLSSRGNFDDDAAAIEKRLKGWNEKTKPVAAKHKAFQINADRSANEIGIEYLFIDILKYCYQIMLIRLFIIFCFKFCF